MDFKILFWLFCLIIATLGETSLETGSADGELALDNYDSDSGENGSIASRASSVEVPIVDATQEKATLDANDNQDGKNSSPEEDDEIEIDDPYLHNPNHCNRTILSCVNIDCCKKVCVYNNENDVCLNDCIDDCINYNKNKIKVHVELLEVKPQGDNAIIELAGEAVTMANPVGERCCSIDLPQHCIKIIDYPYYKCETEKRAVCGPICEVNSIEITQVLDDDLSNMLTKPSIPTPNLTEIQLSGGSEIHTTTSESITTISTEPDPIATNEPISTTNLIMKITPPITLSPATRINAGVPDSPVIWNNYNPPMSPQNYIPNYVYPYYYQHDYNPYLSYNPYLNYAPYQSYNPYPYYNPYPTYNPYPVYNPYPTYDPYQLYYNPYMQYPSYQVYYYVVGNCHPMQWVKPSIPEMPMVPPNTTPSSGVELNVPAE